MITLHSLAGLMLVTVCMLLGGRAWAGSAIASFNDVSGPNAVEGASLTALSTTITAGGVGFITGYDQGNSSVIVLRTNDLAVGLANYVSGQTNSANHWSVSATIGSSGLARRAKTRDVLPLSGTVWFSFLASLINSNGDVALTFNGQVGSGTFNTTPGMRVGVGNPAFPGALAVGPVASQASHATVVNGMNGAITTNNLAPTDGTPGLVLGRISTESGTGYPMIEIWYNPDVASAANLPAPNLSFVDSSFAVIPSSITRIGYQVVRSTNSKQNEVIDNVKLSDEANGFDIVYKSVALPVPLLSVSVLSEGNETGPANVVFQITADRSVATPVTGTYRYTGLATNGYNGAEFVGADYSDANFDIYTQSGSFTIPAGQSNVTVVLAVIDDSTPEGDESIGILLDSGAGYVLGASSAVSLIRENNDANASLQYLFTRTFMPQIFDPTIQASAFSVAGVGGGFSVTEGLFLSPDASARAAGQVTPGNAQDALANGSYMSFFISPSLGHRLTLTNIQFQALYGNYQFQEPSAAEAVIFLRSSMDNFSSDIVTWTLQPDSLVFPPWYDLNLPLGAAFSDMLGNVEFRLYMYDDSGTNQVGIRIDDLFIRGSTVPIAGAQQVSVTAIADAAEPATAGQFSINRAGETNAALTVHYSVSGPASNGVDYVWLPGSVVIPAGESSVVVTVTPIDDEQIEVGEAVILTLSPDAHYGIVLPSSATVAIADDGDFGGLVGYLFNENNNSGATLAALAAPSTKHPDKVQGMNAAAGPGIGNFGVNNAAGVGHGYATANFHSGPSALYIRGEYLAENASDAFTQGGYVSFVFAAKPGFALTLTNFTAFLKMNGTPDAITWVFLRSSLDNFTSDLGASSVDGTATAISYKEWAAPLNVAKHAGEIEFRIYCYNNTDVIFRLDDVGFHGVATPSASAPRIDHIALAGATVTINFTASGGADPNAFGLETSTAASGGFSPDKTAMITGSNGTFQAVTAINGPTRFYRIRAD